MHRVTLAYLDLYGEDPEPEADSDEQPAKADLHGTIAGQFEVAANREHQVIDVIGGFGFGPPRR